MNWKILFNCLYFSSISLYGIAQSDSLVNLSKEDTANVNSLLKQSTDLLKTDPNKAINIAILAKNISQKINFLKGEAYALKNIGLGYFFQGQYVATLSNWRESLNIFEQIDYEIGVANILSNIAAVYISQGDSTKGLDYALRSLKVAEKTGDKLRMLSALNNIGAIYYNKKNTADKVKALNYFISALPLCEAIGNKDALGVISENIGEIYLEIMNEPEKALSYFEKSVIALGDAATSSFAYNGIGKVYMKKGDYNKALSYHNKALTIAEKAKSPLYIEGTLRDIAIFYVEQNNFATALSYFDKARIIAEEIKAISDLQDIYSGMANAYLKTHDYKNAFKYESLSSDIKDTIYNTEKEKKLASLQFDLDMQKWDDSIFLKKNIELEKLRFEKAVTKNRFKTYFLIGGISALAIIVIFLFRNNRQKQKGKEKIEKAYQELKSTQAQLLQREKMASLGELTAGIAHEIQNPLNFVNNFSDVNSELIDELQQEIDKGNYADAKAISNDIKENEGKIKHHGKRADAIVKGMLQHSRTSSGQREPTDINALADEYLRLAYHGLRAKNKSFNAKTETNFDLSIGKLNVVPQEIGRVILNLINNAFYAVDDKKKQNKDGYEPTVTVYTKKEKDKVEIKVKDNGNGIPQKVLDKIFEPFFTTKPAGQGTGLGLSLAYDIVKAHGGELKVETGKSEGAEFIIVLPIN